MAITQDIGIVTAYGYAVSKGYTGTEEEFAQAMVNAGITLDSITDAVDQFLNTTVPTAVQTVQNEGGTQVTNVQNAGTAQIGNVNTAGSTQVSAVQAKGEEVLESIPADYTDLSNDVTDLKVATEEIQSVLPQQAEVVTAVDADTTGWESANFYTGAVGSTITKVAYGQLSCFYYGNVKQGDRFIVTARSIGSGYAIILTDESDKVLENFVSPSGDAYYDEASYTVPYDGKMYLNTATTNYLDGNKVYKLQTYQYNYKSLANPLKNVKWYSIGDSLNEFNRTAETNWIKYMVADTEAVNTNLAKSGSGFYRGSPLSGQTQTNYIKQLESVGSDAELITVAGSLNDLMPSPWEVLPVGTAEDTGSTTIAGYMNAFFDALIAQFPNVTIAVVMTSPWDILHPGVEKSDNYVSVLKAICEKNGIPFNADCYYGCNLRPWNTANKTEFYTHTDSTVDGIHPNSKGHVYIYRMLKPFLEKCVHTVG